MKNEEDEAFDELAKKQGDWGGGFKAKQAMAAGKLQEPTSGDYALGYAEGFNDACKKSAQGPVARVLQIIKELRPAIKPMEGMGKGKTTEEWFDILVKEIERIQPAPKRKWVGLTDEELMEMMGYDKQYGYIPQYARNFAEAIEAKLRSKNNG